MASTSNQKDWHKLETKYVREIGNKYEQQIIYNILYIKIMHLISFIHHCVINTYYILYK